jgi:hypothetical protein
VAREASHASKSAQRARQLCDFAHALERRGYIEIRRDVEKATVMGSWFAGDMA